MLAEPHDAPYLLEGMSKDDSFRLYGRSQRPVDTIVSRGNPQVKSRGDRVRPRPPGAAGCAVACRGPASVSVGLARSRMVSQRSAAMSRKSWWGITQKRPATTASATASATDAGVRPSSMARETWRRMTLFDGAVGRSLTEVGRPVAVGVEDARAHPAGAQHADADRQPDRRHQLVEVLADRHDGMLRRVVARARTRASARPSRRC